jgi:hypothetical protein
MRLENLRCGSALCTEHWLSAQIRRLFRSQTNIPLGSGPRACFKYTIPDVEGVHPPFTTNRYYLLSLFLPARSILWEPALIPVVVPDFILLDLILPDFILESVAPGPTLPSLERIRSDDEVSRSPFIQADSRRDRSLAD